MHQLIEELHQYHRNKAGDLAELTAYLDTFDGSSVCAGVWTDLRHLIRPFHGPLERIHHQNEELILLELKQTGAPIHRRVAEISTDHMAFDRIVGKLVSQIEQAASPVEELCAELNRFVRIYDDHATGEESIFFPIADRYLDTTSWSKVARDWVRQ